MTQPLSVLLIEDSEDDALLLMRELRRSGYDPEVKRVETPEAMEKALKNGSWNIIISDYVLPRFNGIAALTILKNSGLDIPFIIMSGKIGEEVAVDAMKAGAHDYVMKDNMRRLGQAVVRELREAAVRRERKAAEEALKAYTARLEIMNQELQDFAFIASHDLQEPLRKIQTFGGMLRKNCAAELGRTGTDYLMRMERAADRMRQLIQDLIKFSRVAAKPEPYKTVNLNGLFQEVIHLFELRLMCQGVKIVVSDLPTIEADETQMKQLFQNLIGNAVKYTKKDVAPEIRVYSKMENDAMCQILIEDNGIGFQQEFARKIFAPFQRLHTRSEYEGTGMGLAICRKIVERHGGAITARSLPGKGSTFTIDLPVRQPGGKATGGVDAGR